MNFYWLFLLGLRVLLESNWPLFAKPDGSGHEVKRTAGLQQLWNTGIRFQNRQQTKRLR